MKWFVRYVEKATYSVNFIVNQHVLKLKRPNVLQDRYIIPNFNKRCVCVGGGVVFGKRLYVACTAVFRTENRS